MLQRDRAIEFVLFLALACLLVLATSCGTAPQYPRHPLVEQILKPRQGYTGLTNRACKNYNEKNECTVWEIIEYKLEDPVFRATATKLGIICNVAGKRFKICPDHPALCRITYKGFIFKTKKTDYLPITDYQFLIDANTRCMSLESYPFDLGG